MEPESLDQGIVLRSLASERDYRQCLELQRETWGDSFNELVPPTIQRISQKVGGVAVGAFRGDEILGFVYGLSGIRDDRRVHWSHMLAVTRAARGLGLGKSLKMYQRRMLLEIGVESVFWTFDPLVARNANLNLNRLGARPVEYARDMYGTDTGSEMHSGLGTDRFVVEWKIGSGDVADSIAAERSLFVEPPPEQAIVTLHSPVSGAGGFPDEPLVWIEVPERIGDLQRQDRDQALEWRRLTRAAFEHFLAAGFEITGLDRTRAPSRSLYRLQRDRG